MANQFTDRVFRGMAGAHAAMFTPFDRKGRIDEETIGRLIDYGIREGLKGFYLTGSTGEGMLLTSAERVQVYRAAVRAAAKWQLEVNRLVDLVVAEFPDNWTGFKVLMRHVGIDCGPCRAPYAPLAPAEIRRRLAAFARLGIVEKDFANRTVR